jgi:hypothetical protein
LMQSTIRLTGQLMTKPLQKRTGLNRCLLDGVQFDVPLIALTRDDPDYDRRERMNGPDHYREAERLLAEATTRGDFNPRAQWCLELAKLHTALAHVAATALTPDGREWVEVAGRRFCDMTLALQERART